MRYIVSASFLGLIVGVLGLYYTLRASRTHLAIDITAESNVLDVRTSVKNLAVLFQGRDIQQENLNLKILTVQIVNQGEVNMLETYFDSRNPWGLQVQGGRLIEARIIGSNSGYLNENLQPKIIDNKYVTLEKVIFDRGKYVTLELLVLHAKDAEPRVIALGKIAGMDEIAVTSSFKEHDQQGFFSAVVKGPASVQIARSITYFLITLVALFACGLSIAGIVGVVSHFKKKSRRRRARFLPRDESPEKEKKRQILLDVYADGGLEGLSRLHDVLSNKELLKTMLSGRRLSPKLSHELAPDASWRIETQSEIIRFHPAIPSSVAWLVEEGLIRVSGESVDVDPDVVDLLSGLIAQLKGVGG